jgi:hypothetical protein
MIGRKARLTAALLTGGLLAAALPMTANADTATRDAVFCRAIGLSDDGQRACMDQLMNATSAQQRADLQSAWVSRSAIAEKDYSGSLYNPPIDDNQMNGTPGTPYQGKVRGVPNVVAADIHRALKANNLE